MKATVYYYIISAVTLIVIFAVTSALLRKNKGNGLLIKIFAAVAGVALFVRHMLGEDKISAIVSMQVSADFPDKASIIFALVLVTLYFAGFLAIVLDPYFRSRSLEKIVAVFGTAVFTLIFFAIPQYITAIEGVAATETLSVRAVMIALGTGYGLGYSMARLLHCRWEKTVGAWWIAVAVVAMILVNIPNYAMNAVIGTENITWYLKDFSLAHRIALYFAFIIPLVLYLVLKRTSIENRRLVLLYYALASLIIFSNDFRLADMQRLSNLPLHLCHTAMYITPLCLMFNGRKVFYFTYFINVLGAFIALLVPNYGESVVTSASVVLFWVNHYQAFFMPLLVVGLGIFPRPRLKEFKYSMIGFAVYFVFILFINALFTNFDPGVDYFFLNSNYIADKLGEWAENLRNVVWSFDWNVNGRQLTLTFYPVYQLLFFIVYVFLALGVWFVYELGYDVVVSWADIRNRNKIYRADRIALQSALNGRNIEEPLNMNNSDKLILKNLTKRYGKSDVYAVKDANLEVNGGEVFGFLGPNGAGKSTIIKSIVGIQTITDGTIEVCGYDVKRQPVQAKRQIGFVPDHYALYEKLTAREYINYVADLYDVDKKTRDERLNRFIELFEFRSAIDNQIKTYSHGMKQKVTIMAALIHNPKVWILDEPLTGLDPNSIYQVKECMKQHAQEGNIVFFSSHIIDVVERICDRIAIIRKGQIQCVRSVQEIENSGMTLEQFYMDVVEGSEVLPVAVHPKDAEVAK